MIDVEVSNGHVWHDSKDRNTFATTLWIDKGL